MKSQFLQRIAFSLAAIPISLISGTTRADLVLTVAPFQPGQTIWTFSGSTNATGSLDAGSGIGAAQGNGWQGGVLEVSGFQYTAINNSVFAAASGNAMISDSDETANITGIYIDDDGGGMNADDLGFTVDAPLTYASDTVTWSGFVVANIDFTDITEAGLYDVTYQTGGSGSGLQNLNFVAVPEPSVALVGGLLTFGLAAKRRRQRDPE